MTLEAVDRLGIPSRAGARLADRVRPSVVQVSSGGRGGGHGGGYGAGAGMIWTTDGAVLTNHHVVARSMEVRVTLHDGRELDAEVVDRSPGLDLALLQLRETPEDLQAAPVGDAGALRVGELVFAVGNPWGRRGAVTAGIVSAIGSVPGWRRSARYIQSDVALAPGNSGGPLLNARGEVVGINAMISGGTALAIPSGVAEDWMLNRHTPQSRLGVVLRPVGEYRRRWQRRPAQGLMVVAVEEGSPAEEAGIMVGDVLLEAGGEPVDGSLPDLVARMAGKDLRLRVARGRQTLSLDASIPLP